MSINELSESDVTQNIFYFLTDRTLTPLSEFLHHLCRLRILLYVALQLPAFGATFSIAQTIAAVGFPVIIVSLIPLRTLVVRQMPFSPKELGTVDRSTASPFVRVEIFLSAWVMFDVRPFRTM
ncbi:hypothetical protein EI94DRAFT_1805395 [Lactarius quietus]|nr:hypothetical protein EI94DRAFT_1805395 [Lactarius quietus]